MLVQSRNQGEVVCLSAYDAAGKPVVIEVIVAKASGRVKLAIDAPPAVEIRRKELRDDQRPRKAG